MKTIGIAAALLALSLAAAAQAEDGEPVVVTVPQGDVTVTVEAPDGTSEQDIAAAISGEHAKRDPAAQEASQVAKHKAESEQAHAERVARICDSIPEKSMRNDPSLRRMCQ